MITLDTTPIELYPYLEIGQGSNSDGSVRILNKNLPIQLGRLQKENSKLNALVVCSDLQGLVELNGRHELLGLHLPEYLRMYLEIELGYNEDAKIGVLLCGDLFTSLEKRGASGDVREVWESFNKQFDWVVGVAGNHDRFGNIADEEKFKASEGVYLLHKEELEIDGLSIGGISGIIGRSDKTNRVGEEEYLNSLETLLNKELDFVLIHESPSYSPYNLKGNSKITEVIESNPENTIFCGHCYWEKTLVEFSNSSTVINVDSKVTIFEIKE